MLDEMKITRAKGKTNCPNCGAPIQNDHCEYCGALLVDVCCIPENEPFYLKFINSDGEVSIAKSLLKSVTVDPGDTSCLYVDGTPYLYTRESDTLHIEFSIL